MYQNKIYNCNNETDNVSGLQKHTILTNYQHKIVFIVQTKNIQGKKLILLQKFKFR